MEGEAHWPRIGIIGTGFAGLIVAVKLTQAGCRTFTLLDRNPGPGGTWRQSFPGIGVDVPTHLYSFTFKRRYDWTGSHADAAELREYMAAAIADHGLAPHFRFHTEVKRVVWREAEQAYDVGTAAGETLRFDVVISAIGLFHTISYPSWPGLETFEGPKFHTAAWEHEHDLADKRVAYIGTGSTALQVVPRIAEKAKKLTVYQREPGWALPKPARRFTTAERRRFMRPGRVHLETLRLYLQAEKLAFGLRKRGRANERLRDAGAQYIAERLPDRPDLVAALTPSYPFGGKRPLFDDPNDSFYTALARENVELVPRLVAAVTATGVVDGDGVERAADVLVMSTGYRVADYLATFEVEGRDGLRLHHFWAGDPAAFMGMAVPGFPNFFVLYGPNTNGGTIANMLAIQANFVVANIKRMARKRLSAVEVREPAYRGWDRYVAHINGKTVLHESNSYYKSPSGKIVSEWPNLQLEFWFWTKLLRRPAMAEYRAPRR